MKYFALWILMFWSFTASAASLDLDLSEGNLKAATAGVDAVYEIQPKVANYIRMKTVGGSIQAQALLQLAQDYTRALRHLGNADQALTAARQILKSEFCVRSIFKEDAREVSMKIHALSLDTYERARLGIRLNTYIGHALPYSPPEYAWSQECRFLPAVFTHFIAPSSGASLLQSGISIYFGNGMFNTMNDVSESLTELQKLDLSALENDPIQIQFKPALNLSESDLDDILSVIHQRVQNDLSYFWDVLAGTLPLPDWLKEPIETALLKNIHSDTLSEMLSEYRNDVQNNTKVILISHSQGNFYAEASEKQLVTDFGNPDPHAFGFGNVRVATPARTQFHFPYFTFQDDYIINLVRAVTSAPEANMSELGTGPGPLQDIHGHDFVRAYLANPDAREAIREAIITEVAQIKTHS